MSFIRLDDVTLIEAARDPDPKENRSHSFFATKKSGKTAPGPHRELVFDTDTQLVSIISGEHVRHVHISRVRDLGPDATYRAKLVAAVAAGKKAEK